MSADVTLMRACTILFLFRALASAEDEQHRAQIESQILRLIADLAETPGGGFVLLAKNQAELCALARERGLDVRVIERVCADGAVDGAAPLYVRGAIEGVIGAPQAGAVLSAVATLASAALENVREIENLQVRNSLLEERVETGILGDSAVIQRLIQMVDRLAQQETTVLILGESGTGKELVAEALHAKPADGYAIRAQSTAPR